jgi:polyisoprenyl-phosphate glycosyltransferase
MQLTVVLSFKNEENNLSELYRRITNSLWESQILDYEIIFVNDNSTDNSLNIIIDLINQDPKVSCINMTRSFGVSECVIAGLEKSQGDYCVYLDSDLQDPPEMIPDLLKAATSSNVDVVFTHRTKRLGENWLKLAITKIGYRYLNRYANISMAVEVGDFTLLSRRTVEKVLAHKEQLPFLRGIIANLAYPSVTLDYVRDPRLDGTAASKFHLFSSRWIRSHLDRTLVSFSDVPLKISLALGFLIAFLSFIGIFVDICMKIFGLAIPGWATLVFIVLFLGGIQLLLIGVLGLYINIIFLEVKKRPMYVIESVIGGASREAK